MRINLKDVKKAGNVAQLVECLHGIPEGLALCPALSSERSSNAGMGEVEDGESEGQTIVSYKGASVGCDKS